MSLSCSSMALFRHRDNTQENLHLAVFPTLQNWKLMEKKQKTDQRGSTLLIKISATRFLILFV